MKFQKVRRSRNYVPVSASLRGLPDDVTKHLLQFMTLSSVGSFASTNSVFRNLMISALPKRQTLIIEGLENKSDVLCIKEYQNSEELFVTEEEASRVLNLCTKLEHLTLVDINFFLDLTPIYKPLRNLQHLKTLELKSLCITDFGLYNLLGDRQYDNLVIDHVTIKKTQSEDPNWQDLRLSTLKSLTIAECEWTSQFSTEVASRVQIPNLAKLEFRSSKYSQEVTADGRLLLNYGQALCPCEIVPFAIGKKNLGRLFVFLQSKTFRVECCGAQCPLTRSNKHLSKLKLKPFPRTDVPWIENSGSGIVTKND